MPTKYIYIGWGVTLVLVAIVFFYVGMVHAKPASPTTAPAPAGVPSSTSIVGLMTAHTATSITITPAGAASETLALSSSTQIIAPVSAGQTAPTLATLPNNILVSLVYATDAKGNITVTSITLAPSWDASPSSSH